MEAGRLGGTSMSSVGLWELKKLREASLVLLGFPCLKSKELWAVGSNIAAKFRTLGL